MNILLQAIFKQLVCEGTLKVIDSNGNTTTFKGTPTPEITIRLNTKAIQTRFCYQPMLALGEGYMSGEITVEEGSDIYDLLRFFAVNFKYSSISSLADLMDRFSLIRKLFHNTNSIFNSKKNVAHHYDLSRELYQLFLDKDMQYSCAYFKDLSDDLDTAQENKKIHIAAKLQLKPGMKVLDIGCGWGGLAMTLAQKAGVDVTGLTLSEEQHRFATERVKKAGLEDRVRFHLRDYRDEPGTYDRIVSVGMFEHVGIKHYGEFFSQVRNLLKENGLALLHSISCSLGPSRPNPWLRKYIFPGGYCPALSEAVEAIEPEGLYVTDVEILHHHYAETLRHWRHNCFVHQKEIKEKWGETFYRMWEFYLAGCEVAFRKRGFMVFQIQMMRDPELAALTRDYIGEAETALSSAAPAKKARKKAT